MLGRVHPRPQGLYGVSLEDGNGLGRDDPTRVDTLVDVVDRCRRRAA